MAGSYKGPATFFGRRLFQQKKMKCRLARKLRKEMLSWKSNAKVRHALHQFQAGWRKELKAIRGT